jgi:hypothetical protein
MSDEQRLRRRMVSRARSCLKPCSICGRNKSELRGSWYHPDDLRNLGANLLETVEENGRVYACNRCVDQLVKKARENRLAEMKAGITPLREREKKAMETVLEGLSGWIKIKDLTLSFNKLIGFNDVSEKRMGTLLRRSGFPERKRGTHNYTYAYIEKTEK